MSYYVEMANAALANYEARKNREQGLEEAIKGTAVCLVLDSTGERLWIVAAEEDARQLGERRGEGYTAAEVRIIARLDDADIIDDLRAFKKLAKAAMKRPGCAP
jgi:hypothetical protein